MEAAILIIVIIGTLFAIASGVWVAMALVSAISTHQGKQGSDDRRQKTPSRSTSGSV